MPLNVRMSRAASRSKDGVAGRALRGGRPRVVWLEHAPIDLKPDPWQRWISIGQIVSVVVLAIGLYLSYQANQETSRANREISAANREQQRLAERGQITDRFAKAVEQLGQPGSDKVDVRLGAIYSLERIMRDSADDHPAVVDVLGAFIRLHAPASHSTDKGTAGATQRPSLPVDVQAALTVLGRRDASRDQPQNQLDLAGVNLAGAHLTKANLVHADLARADLARAYLGGADLRFADLTGVKLTGADLTGADLTGAHLADADLRFADLTDAYLGHADLTRANLAGANLTRAHLADAHLADANLRFADLTNANLRFADLRGAHLGYADLTNADLTNADLSYADLRGADLAEANLSGANLRCAWTDEHTRLPAGVARPAECPDRPVPVPR
jgi:uncharacterized protein YjbI with pentapeptide repeats